MKKRRIFIAINLPEKVKKRLKEYQEKSDVLPVRWTKAPSLHLTLVFIGYVSNEQMLEACRVAREVASGAEPFFINFKRIALGPSFAKASEGKPRMIWLEGEKNEDLSRLRDKLQDALFGADTGFTRKDNKPFNPHITLARVKVSEWRQAQIGAADVEADFIVQVEVSSIEVMESDLKYDGAEYATLESCPLGE